MCCSGWPNSPHDTQDSILGTSILVMRSEFHLDGSPPDFRKNDFPKDDFPKPDYPPGPMHAPAAATSPEHGKRLQQPWRLRHRVPGSRRDALWQPLSDGRDSPAQTVHGSGSQPVDAASAPRSARDAIREPMIAVAALDARLLHHDRR